MYSHPAAKSDSGNHPPATRAEKMKPVQDQFADDCVWYGLSFSKGWDDIVLQLHHALLELDPDYEVVQAKEKFGGLRYYTNHNHNNNCGFNGGYYCGLNTRIKTTEVLSLTTCEMCGGPGTTSLPPGWVRTLCQACRQIWEGPFTKSILGLEYSDLKFEKD